MRFSLTDFIDFVSKAGTPKLTKVREVKNRGEWEPAKDYYLPIRARILDALRSGRVPTVAQLLGPTNPKKHGHYEPIAKGAVKWMRKHKGCWVDPPREIWTASGVDVSVNPEVGVRLDGRLHVLKLYFKAEPLAARRITLIAHLMERALRHAVPKTAVMGVLDVRRARVFIPPACDARLDTQLLGEAAFIAATWNSA